MHVGLGRPAVQSHYPPCDQDTETQSQWQFTVGKSKSRATGKYAEGEKGEQKRIQNTRKETIRERMGRRCLRGIN